MKTLIVYYSNSGNTEAAAKKIADELSADLLKLIPEREIPGEGFSKFFLGGMRSTLGQGTKLKGYDLKPNEYSQIILGTPVWASGPTPAVNQFLKDISDTSRITSLFTFSSGGENEKCIQIIKKNIPSLKHSVSLCDRKFPERAKDNDQKLKGFIEACRGI